MIRQARWLLRCGVVLFLLGLLTGFAVPSFAIPRLGFTAHIEGVLGGVVLLVLGLLWPQLRLGPRGSHAASGLAVYALATGWLAPLAAGVWGAGGAMLPFAAGAARGSGLQEALIGGALVTAGVAIIAVCPILLAGLRGADRPGDA